MECEEEKMCAIQMSINDGNVNTCNFEAINIESYDGITVSTLVQNKVQNEKIHGAVPIKPKPPDIQVPDATVSTCEIQNESLANKSSHIIRSRIKYHVCDICNKTFLRPSHVLRHKNGVHKVDVGNVQKISSGKYECRVCENRFANVQNRRRHEIKLHKFYPKYKQQLKCPDCQSVFPSQYEVSLHISCAHPEISTKTENLCFQLSPESPVEKCR